MYTSRIWLFLSVIFVIRGLSVVWQWYEQGFALDYLSWRVGLRLITLAFGIYLLIKQYQHWRASKQSQEADAS
jgi:hypothetical protein